MKSALFAIPALLAATQLLAQNTQQPGAIAESDVLSQISMFSYREGPKSDLFLRGTPIAANARGKVTVEYEDDNARISANVEDLPDPWSLGPYTTYVLWALTPDGRAINQGVVATGNKGEIYTSYGSSQFALIVTAEPHFAVSAPSTMLALYNVADKVEGSESKVSTLTERSDYSKLSAIRIDDENPVEIVQARYAVGIANAAEARRLAPQEYAKASSGLDTAEKALSGGRKDRKTAADSARESVLAAEDARRAAMAGAAAERAEEGRAAAAAVGAEEGARAGARLARQELLVRLNEALPTRETDRGLVSEIGGVQFATGTANLGPAAREGLARFGGIVASYPRLRINVEGHTDSTGSLATNNELSLRRAIAVRDYLIGQGIAASRIEVMGLGPSRPIASNDTAEGRTRNRRVELVLETDQPIE